MIDKAKCSGASPSGKAAGFGPAIRRFESFRPSFSQQTRAIKFDLLVVANGLRVGLVASSYNIENDQPRLA
jgi:hypothetical protein